MGMRSATIKADWLNAATDAQLGEMLTCLRTNLGNDFVSCKYAESAAGKCPVVERRQQSHLTQRAKRA